MALTPEQEAQYALDYNLGSQDLKPGAKEIYDDLVVRRQQAASRPQASPFPAAAAGTPRTSPAATLAGLALSARQLRGVFLTAAGVILFIIWIILNSMTVEGMSAQGFSSLCNSALGQIGQGFDATAAADCGRASTLATWQTICFWLGLAMIAWGLERVFGRRRVRSRVR